MATSAVNRGETARRVEYMGAREAMTKRGDQFVCHGNGGGGRCPSW